MPLRLYTRMWRVVYRLNTQKTFASANVFLLSDFRSIRYCLLWRKQDNVSFFRDAAENENFDLNPAIRRDGKLTIAVTCLPVRSPGSYRFVIWALDCFMPISSPKSIVILMAGTFASGNTSAFTTVPILRSSDKIFNDCHIKNSFLQSCYQKEEAVYLTDFQDYLSD